jgi:hypothetical protein
VNDATSDVIPKSVRPLMNNRDSVDSPSDTASDFASKISDTTYEMEADDEHTNSQPQTPQSVIYREDSLQDKTEYVFSILLGSEAKVM